MRTVSSAPRVFAWAVACAILAGCAGAPVAPPRIERLAEGAAGPVAPARTAPLTLDEVVKMAAAGSPSNVIIQTLRDSRASYRLSAAEGEALSRRGVPGEVIDYLRSGEEPGRRPRHVRRYAPDPYPFYPWGPYYYGPYGPGLYGGSDLHWHPGTGFYFGLGRRW